MNLPPKSSFKFQELPTITGIKPYVLRFWETEFEEIVPIADESGEKHYSRADVEMIMQIKGLLFDKKMSITEAKGLLRGPDMRQEVVNRAEAMDVAGPLLEALKLVQEIKQRHHW